MYFRKDASNAEIIYKSGMHELTHAIENTKHYAYVSNYVLNKKFGGAESDKYKKAIAAKIAEYEKNGATLNEDEAKAELVAENLRKAVFATDEDVRRIVEQDYTFAQHVHDWIGDMLYWVKNTFGHMDEKAQLQADLEQAQRKYRLALSSTNGTKYVGAESQYSIYMVSGKPRVFIDSDITRGKNPIDTPGKLKKFLLQKYDKIPYVRENGKIGMLHFDEQSAEEYAYSEYSKRLVGTEKYDKYRAANNLDEIVNVQTNETYEDPKHPRKDDIVGFYRAFVEVQIKNRLYKAELLTGIDLTGTEKFYDIVGMDLISKNEPYPTLADEFSFNGRRDSDSFDNNIPQPDSTVKNQMSFSSPKTDNAPAGVEDFDVKENREVSPELQKQLDDHVFNVQSDGSVRTLAQEKAARAEQAQSNSAPALDKQLTDNPDVAAIVQNSNVKRAEDITFAPFNGFCV